MATSAVKGARANLKRHIEQRVTELRLKWREVAERSGYAVSWIRHIRNDPNKVVTPDFATALDRALEWEPGSTTAILDGGEPTPRRTSSAVPLSPVGERRPRRESGSDIGGDLAVSDSVLEVMERWQQKLTGRDYAQLTLDLMRIREGAYREGWRAAEADLVDP